MATTRDEIRPDEIGGDSDDGFEVIHPGGRGAALTDAQLRLRILDPELPLEDTLGPATEARLRRVQREHALPESGALDYATYVVILGETGDRRTVWDIAAPDEALADQAGGAVSFAVGASRDVAGQGGYRYRQWEDGEIEILATPSGRGVGSTYFEGKVWEAITREIGPFPKGEAGGAPAPTPAPATPTSPPPADPGLAALRDQWRGKLPGLVAAHPAEARDRIARVLGAAIDMIGLREIPKGSNGGPEIGVITDGFAGNAPPWCALAVSHWVRTGLGCTDWKQLPWGNRNARALTFGQWGEAKGRFLAATNAAPPGAIYVMYRDASGSDAAGARKAGTAKWEGNGHTGLVLEDNGTTITTVDGNVSDMIKVCTRKKSEVIGYVTWW